MSRIILIIVSLFLFSGVILDSDREVPVKYRRISGKAFWGMVLLCSLFKVRSILATSILTGIAIVYIWKYIQGTKSSRGLHEVVYMTALDIAHKVVVALAIVNGRYDLVLLATVVMYTTTVLLEFYIGKVGKRKA